MPSVVRVFRQADGRPTPYDGQYIKSWNPHTKAGEIQIETTSDISEAKKFQDSQVFHEWSTVSNVQPTRPWDGKPNKPLTGINIEIIQVKE